MRYWLGIGWALALAAAAPAEAEMVVAERTLATGIELRTDRGVLTLEPWSDSIVHVRFGPQGYAGNYNPAVIAQPQKVRFTVRQSGGEWVLTTARLQVRVARATGLVTFADARGSTLLAEAERNIGAGTVAAFATRTPLFGLGQHHNGLLDYSGSTVHLQQKNGDVAVPMMLSPKGFGILWNNASVMDVDVAKPDAKLPLVIRNAAGAGIDYDFILGPEAD